MTAHRVTAAEIDAARTPAGGWTREQLAQWGVSWPPPKGWRRALILSGLGKHLPDSSEGAHSGLLIERTLDDLDMPVHVLQQSLSPFVVKASFAQAEEQICHEDRVEAPQVGDTCGDRVSLFRGHADSPSGGIVA